MRMNFSNIADAGTRFRKGYSPKNVFVFGAGLSIPAGLPAAASLLKRAFNWKEEFALTLNTTLIEDLCDYFYPGLQRSMDQYPDAEDLLGMMESARAYDSVRGRGRGYRWRSGYISDAQRQLSRLLGEFLWSFQRNEMIDRISHIRNIVRDHKANTIFVTFNYDLLLEMALTLEGIEFSYAIDKKDNDRNVILKPHGSINWSLPSDYSRCKDWQRDRCIHFLDRIFVYDEIFPAFLREGINPDYIFIAPTPNKQIEIEFLKRQWTSFSSSIHSCRNITIVGYSLPAADRLARIVLRRSGPRHHIGRRITVIDPGDLADHYRKHISPGINYIQDYCENYFAA